MVGMWRFCLLFWKDTLIKLMSKSVNGGSVGISDIQGMWFEGKPNHNEKE